LGWWDEILMQLSSGVAGLRYIKSYRKPSLWGLDSLRIIDATLEFSPELLHKVIIILT
jgi:hypothetical protein